MKKTVIVFCGGKSSEHQISIRSARSVWANLSENEFEKKLIAITVEGQFFWADPVVDLNQKSQFNDVDFKQHKKLEWVEFKQFDELCLFPVLHGPFYEDGSLQGLFESLGHAYVGCDVKTSALCMDKVITKALLKTQNIPVVDSLYFNHDDQWQDDERLKKLHYPVFVKAASQGSSIGVYKSESYEDACQYIKKAFEFDQRVLVEQGIEGRELEMAYLEGHNESLNVVGEIIVNSSHYDFESKYNDPDQKLCQLAVDVELPEKILTKMKDYVSQAVHILGIDSLARIDFFYDSKNEKLYINEINTMPGFTSISMYPKLIEKMGMNYSALLSYLIELADNRQQRKSLLKKTV